MDNYTTNTNKCCENKDFAPTMESLIQVLMDTGLVTEQQASGMAATALQLERIKNG